MSIVMRIDSVSQWCRRSYIKLDWCDSGWNALKIDLNWLLSEGTGNVIASRIETLSMKLSDHLRQKRLMLSSRYFVICIDYCVVRFVCVAVPWRMRTGWCSLHFISRQSLDGILLCTGQSGCHFLTLVTRCSGFK